MMTCPLGWEDYELLDCGGEMKLERWGAYLVARPEPRVIWSKGDPEMWKRADAVFENDSWKFKSEPPQEWTVSYRMRSLDYARDFGERALFFRLRPTDFKHTGVFPEQAVNWDYISAKCEVLRAKGMAPKILNLFAYTGGATMAAALAGAQVTHVDASKPALTWASENAQLANIPRDKIRWIQDDVLKFVKREINRGVRYDGIIMDPPRFGRGASGEVWKLEEHLPSLVRAAKELLSPTPQLFLINAYTADLSSVALGNLLASVLGQEVECGELGIKESGGRGFVLPAGVFARWSGPESFISKDS